MTTQDERDSTCSRSTGSGVGRDLLPKAGENIYMLLAGRAQHTSRKTEVLNFTAEDVTLRQTTYEFTCTEMERGVVRGRRLHVLGLIEKKTLPLSTVLDEEGRPLHTLPTADNGVLGEALLMHLWTQAKGAPRDADLVQSAVHDVVFATKDPDKRDDVCEAVLKTVADEEGSAAYDLLAALLRDLYQSYIFCVELPDKDDGDRCAIQFSYAASVGLPPTASPKRSDTGRVEDHARAEGVGAFVRACGGALSRLSSVGTARFVIDVAGLNDAQSTHIQIRVPAGLRVSRLRSLPDSQADLGEKPQQAWAHNRGWATGGVAYWRPPSEDRGRVPQARLELDLALETRGILTAICAISTILTTALSLLLWVYPSMHPDKEAQDVLVTGILIAPSLVTSFVVANREPGVVSGVAQLPRLILLVNLLVLLGCAVFTITDRAAQPGLIDYAALMISGLLSAWLVTTWGLSRRTERSAARDVDESVENKERLRWPIGTFFVPTRHGPQQPHSPMWRCGG